MKVFLLMVVIALMSGCVGTVPYPTPITQNEHCAIEVRDLRLGQSVNFTQTPIFGRSFYSDKVTPIDISPSMEEIVKYEVCRLPEMASAKRIDIMDIQCRREGSGDFLARVQLSVKRQQNSETVLSIGQTPLESSFVAPHCALAISKALNRLPIYLDDMTSR